jgi:hypothetical protein
MTPSFHLWCRHAAAGGKCRHSLRPCQAKVTNDLCDTSSTRVFFVRRLRIRSQVRHVCICSLYACASAFTTLLSHKSITAACRVQRLICRGVIYPVYKRTLFWHAHTCLYVLAPQAHQSLKHYPYCGLSRNGRAFSDIWRHTSLKIRQRLENS